MKLVILVRKDLKMPKGKMSAQCSHAAVESVLKSSKEKVGEWREEGGTKVVLEVKNLDELMEYKKKALSAKLVNALIKDAGRTFFKESTVTCLGIGPDEDDKIDKVCGGLKLA